MTRDRRRRLWIILSCLVLILVSLRLFIASSYFDPSPNPAKKVVVVFRNDDIQEFSGSAMDHRFLKLFADNGIPQTYALVPFKKALGGELVSLLKEQQARGLAEIALHGYAHQNLARKGKSEFAGRPFEEQAGKIRSGKAHLERIFQREVVTFIPPFNSYDSNTLRACSQEGIKVLSSSHFFQVPNPYPLQVANLNFLLTDPASYVELASGHGGDLSIFVVYYHSYMEAIYRSDDYFGKATRLIQTIRRHGNIEVDTLGNVALRHAGYFRERVLLDAWFSKTAVFLSFFRQTSLVERLSRLYYCNGPGSWPLVVLALLYGMGLSFSAGFALGFPIVMLWNALSLSGRWTRRLSMLLGLIWFLGMIVMSVDDRFGIIDMAAGVLLAGSLLHLVVGTGQNLRENESTL
ncbi:MAG: DUF2334 domain-containing protein [Deltaproteobacteria bacterium]|nr:DUF2334 domain-containing protein [Deltaproteobacteria bacterium]